MEDEPAVIRAELMAFRDTVKKIAAMPDEDDERDGCDKFREARATARSTLMAYGD